MNFIEHISRDKAFVFMNNFPQITLTSNIPWNFPVSISLSIPAICTQLAGTINHN